MLFFLISPFCRQLKFCQGIDEKDKDTVECRMNHPSFALPGNLELLQVVQLLVFAWTSRRENSAGASSGEEENSLGP